MSHDFARRNPRKKNKKNTRNVNRRTAPRWLWLASGIACGLLLAFLYHLITVPAAVPKTGKNAQAPATKESENHRVKFNFYKLLPERKVEVHDRRAPNSLPPAKPAPTSSASSGKQYYLQAGSFGRREDAEKRRVQLLLLNTDADINQIKHDGKTWFRVEAGPYGSSSQIATIRGKLLDEGIETLVTQRKSK